MDSITWSRVHDHRRVLPEEKHAEKVFRLTQPVRYHFLVGGLAIPPAIPGVVVIGPVHVVFEVSIELSLPETAHKHMRDEPVQLSVCMMSVGSPSEESKRRRYTSCASCKNRVKFTALLYMAALSTFRKSSCCTGIMLLPWHGSLKASALSASRPSAGTLFLASPS